MDGTTSTPRARIVSCTTSIRVRRKPPRRSVGFRHALPNPPVFALPINDVTTVDIPDAGVSLTISGRFPTSGSVTGAFLAAPAMSAAGSRIKPGIGSVSVSRAYSGNVCQCGAGTRSASLGRVNNSNCCGLVGVALELPVGSLMLRSKLEFAMRHFVRWPHREAIPTTVAWITLSGEGELSP